MPGKAQGLQLGFPQEIASSASLPTYLGVERIVVSTTDIGTAVDQQVR